MFFNADIYILEKNLVMIMELIYIVYQVWFGASSWTSQMGYVGTNKMSQTFVFDKNMGLSEIIYTIV